MSRYSWVAEVRPGYEEKYKRRHDEIWPEMIEALREAGIRNYSIFRHGLTLFGYFETDDLDWTREYLAKNEVNRRWGEAERYAGRGRASLRRAASGAPRVAGARRLQGVRRPRWA